SPYHACRSSTVSSGVGLSMMGIRASNPQRCGEFGGFPLPKGERARVRGFELTERASPPHPTPLPNGEREQTEPAALLPYSATIEAAKHGPLQGRLRAPPNWPTLSRSRL